MSEKWEDDFYKKLKEAEVALREAETILNANGVSGPVRQLKNMDRKKIVIPGGYIRKAASFVELYQLGELVSRNETRRNISYALQVTDLLNYIINRFELGTLSVASVFYRLSTAHVFSVIEAMIYGMAHRLHMACRTGDLACPSAGRCVQYYKNPKDMKFNTVFNKLREDDIITFSEADIDMIRKAKDTRDRLHMWLSEDADFYDKKFGISDYNGAIQILHKMRLAAGEQYRDNIDKRTSCPERRCS